jgi:hypothetical protein
MDPLPKNTVGVQAWGESRPASFPAPSSTDKPLLSLSLSHSIIEDMVSEAQGKHILTPAERRTLKHKMEGSWRLRLGALCEHHYTHAAILVFIFIDVACVLCELMLRDVCPAPIVGSPDAKTLHKWEEGLSWSSRSILFLLLIHQLGLVVAYGISYFKKVAYVLDLVIVGVAIALEMALLALEMREGGGHRRALSDPAPGGAPHDDSHSEIKSEEIARLVVVLLAWRVVRIIHGFVLTNASNLEDGHELELLEAKAKIIELEKQLAVYKGGGEEGGVVAGVGGDSSLTRGDSLSFALARSGTQVI